MRKMRHDSFRSMRLMALVGCLSPLLAACGGGGGGGGGTPSPPGSTVVVSGKITFDRIPFSTTLGGGLNPSAPVESPAREVVVEAINTRNTVVASAVTDAAGDYSLTVPASTSIFLRAKAQMLKTGSAPTWNFSIRNNTNGDALYVLDGSNFDTGTANSTRNLRATSGWGGSSYTGTRAAAPFAILDTVYRAKQLILAASAATVFPELNLFWSSSNRPAAPFCPDNGNIGTSSYVVFGSPPDNLDGCNPQQTGVSGIYILGDFSQQDTDEFDQHVIAHEFGHYVEDQFSRSDSIGGSHGPDQRLDLRLAFGEGWGNAYSAMVLDDPVYRDSGNGVSQDGGFNLESQNISPEGWFSEHSVGKILWDIFDTQNEAGDTVTLGFGPIYSVMSGPQISTDAFTSIFSFSAAIRSAASSADSAAIGSLLSNEAINGSGAFAENENNDGGTTDVHPLYRPIDVAQPFNVCSRSDAGNEDANKLGNRKFFRFDVAQARTVTIQAVGAVAGTGIPATDPDIFVIRRGALIAAGTSEVQGNETISQLSLAAGTYIIEVYDFAVDGTSDPNPRCMTVSIQG